MPPAVYVQVPAYRDRELAATLTDLYATAEHPRRLRTRVLWQRAEGEELPSAARALPGLELVALPHTASGGPNWARQQLQRAWAGEPYTLLLDSHHRFVPGWDTMLIDMHTALRDSGVAKPLLTAYLPAYVPANDPDGRRHEPYRIYPLSRDDGVLTRLTSYPIPFWRSLTGPVPADFLSLHMVFADGRFNREVPVDPGIYFFGDEVLVGLRAFRAGYALFHPHVVIGWHAYERKSRSAHWDDHGDWTEAHRASLARLRRAFTHRSAVGYQDSIAIPLVAR